MIIKCAWHMKNFGTELIMGEKPPYEDKGVTHGICPECYKKEMRKMPKREPLYPHVPKSRMREGEQGGESPITQQEITELVNLYHTAQTAVGHSRYDRLVWAAERFHKAHPSISASKAYKLADEATRPYYLKEDSVKTRKFEMGQMVLTRGVNDRVAEDTEFAKFVTVSIARHATGDWGDMSKEDKQENEFSLTRHLRLFSAYEHPKLPKIWIITEADRSVTTVLFPEEY